MTHASIAVKPDKDKRSKEYIFKGSNKPSAFGILVVMVLKMLTRTRKMVISSVILPGTTSGGIRNEIQDTMTNIPEGR